MLWTTAEWSDTSTHGEHLRYRSACIGGSSGIPSESAYALCLVLLRADIVYQLLDYELRRLTEDSARAQQVDEPRPTSHPVHTNKIGRESGGYCQAAGEDVDKATLKGIALL